MFKDAKDLRHPTAPTHVNGGGEGEATVAPFDCMLAGFPCKAASLLNTQAASDANRTCISQKSDSTGSVFAYLMDMLEMHGHRLRMLLLENVLGLATPPRHGGPSNLDMVIQQLSQRLSMHIKAWHLDPRDFGTPQSRGRVWICAVPRASIERMGFTAIDFDKLLSTIMQQLVGVELTPLHDLLLEDVSPMLMVAHGVAKLNELKVKASTHPARPHAAGPCGPMKIRKRT